MSVSGDRSRLRALDGIRAFAIATVLLYHGGVSWVFGGLLGVDVFFVLSGFLITSLLCDEFHRLQTIRFGRFWAARARRLLPGLFLLLLGVGAYALWLRHSLDLESIRADALPTLLYVANWHRTALQSYTCDPSISRLGLRADGRRAVRAPHRAGRHGLPSPAGNARQFPGRCRSAMTRRTLRATTRVLRRGRRMR